MLAQRRRRSKPCDACRRRKVRCDGNATDNAMCSNCKSFKFECTYTGNRDKEGYIKDLELEVQRLKTTLEEVNRRSPSVAATASSSRLSRSSSPLPPKNEPLMFSETRSELNNIPNNGLLALLAEELSQFSPVPEVTHQHIDPRNLTSTPTLGFNDSAYLSPGPSIVRRNSPIASAKSLLNKQEVPLESIGRPEPKNGQHPLVQDGHLPVLKDSLQWPTDENLYMWSSPACDAWEEWDSYTASISALTAGVRSS